MPSPSPTSSSSVVNAVGQGNYEFSSSLKSSSMPTSSIDNAIDEDTYFIGGGDKLHIYLVDMPSLNYGGIITQDFYFIEPTLGVIPVGGKMSLSNAKKIIADYMNRKLKGKGPNQVRILFEGVKTAHITAFGSVHHPGSYSFPGNARLWDVLKTISSVNLSDLNFREIRVKNGDSVVYYDLLSFLYKGDFSQNPYVYPGDELFVSPALKRAYIGGGGLRAWISGQVPIHNDETARDFLSFFFFNETADSEHILIQRTEEGREFQQITFNLKSKRSFILKNNDVIIIPVKNDSSKVHLVNATGELIRPGSYPIPKGGTAVQTIIALAGGYTSFADTNRTVILRTNKKPPPPTVTDGVSRPEISGALAAAAATKDFLVIRITDHPETVLKPEDHVYIPRIENTVYLSGRVKAPGGYAFKPHKKKEYYIRLAGGFADRADKSNIAIVSPFLDAFLTKSTNSEIEAGDFIAVPVNKEYKLYEKIVLPTLSMLLASAGFLVGIVSILR
ncbi:MAG: SLBB domain-containing protein [Chitinispirillaceae bacterium]|nr:SLBB domain-containing protein [Chitinispirillaceae bacterium]